MNKRSFIFLILFILSSIIIPIRLINHNKKYEKKISIINKRNTITLLHPWGNNKERYSMIKNFKRIFEKNTDKYTYIDIININNSEEIFKLVSSGQYAMYHYSDSYLIDKKMSFCLFSGMPFSMTASEITAWLIYKEGQKTWDNLYSEYNIKPYALGYVSAQMNGWSNYKIESLKDLQKIKARYVGLSYEVMKRIMGDNVEKHSIPDAIALAFEKKIDLVELSNPSFDIQTGIQKKLKYYYGPSLIESCGFYTLGINKETLSSLDHSTREALVYSAEVVSYRSLINNEYSNSQALQEIGTERIVPFPEEVLEQIVQNAKETILIKLNEDKQFLELYRGYIKHANNNPMLRIGKKNQKYKETYLSEIQKILK